MPPRVHPPELLIPSRKLTPREAEIVDLVSRGLLVSEVAEKLKISDKTVESHMTRIREKKAVGTAAGVVGASLREGDIS
jgi:DNA-binding NarL/FixJ family response regulator